MKMLKQKSKIIYLAAFALFFLVAQTSARFQCKEPDFSPNVYKTLRNKGKFMSKSVLHDFDLILSNCVDYMSGEYGFMVTHFDQDYKKACFTASLYPQVGISYPISGPGIKQYINLKIKENFYTLDATHDENLIRIQKRLVAVKSTKEKLPAALEWFQYIFSEIQKHITEPFGDKEKPKKFLHKDSISLGGKILLIPYGELEQNFKENLPILEELLRVAYPGKVREFCELVGKLKTKKANDNESVERFINGFKFK